jgi:hypothetical protein
MKICLIGLPRCGSQYISALIAKSFEGMTNLVEPYTNKHVANIINVDNWIDVCRMPDNFESYQKRIEYVSNTLKSGTPDQSMVMKLFLTDDTYLYVNEIIDTLKMLNFKFVVVKRENVEHHILSHIIAMKTNKWNSVDDGVHNHLDKFKITNLTDIDWLYRQIANFDNVVNGLNVNYATVRYEHALDDLTSVLKKQINTDIDIEKQIVGDPWDMIENADEIKEIIQKVINGTKLY